MFRGRFVCGTGQPARSPSADALLRYTGIKLQKREERGRGACSHSRGMSALQRWMRRCSCCRVSGGSRVLGGGMWMRLSHRSVPCVIDLSELRAQHHRGNRRCVSHRRLRTLRDLERADAFNEATGGVLNAAVQDIVGVQFRRLATVGGSVFGRLASPTFSAPC